MINPNPTPTPRTQPVIEEAYDVVIAGAGPAGCTVAALVAEQGHSVLLLDRSPFPRFHVGESLIPETYWTLKRLGLIEQLQQSAFPKKYSVQFVTETGVVTSPFYFDDYKPHESSQTWQVIRGEFDEMLLENAVAKGAVAHTCAQLREVLFEGERAVGIRARFGSADDGAVMRDVAAKVVVDATGQSAFLATRLGLKSTDPCLKMGTVWTYYRGALRDEGRDEGATLIMQTEGKRSWFWYIPLPDDVVSVGCTGSISEMFGVAGRKSEDIFHAELERCPEMQRRLDGAERQTECFTTKDYSYRSSQAAGPGWVLVGDAFGFIDPVYSSGVYLALKSGEFAADAIHAALTDGELTGERLGSWHQEYVSGLELFRKLVYAFYTPGFSFGTFLRDHPQYRSNLIDILIGDVYKPGVGEIFKAMDPALAECAAAASAPAALN